MILSETQSGTLAKLDNWCLSARVLEANTFDSNVCSCMFSGSNISKSRGSDNCCHWWQGFGSIAYFTIMQTRFRISMMHIINPDSKYLSKASVSPLIPCSI
jgi:hypothetical protein